MKVSNTILLVTFCVATAGLFGSNYVIKKEYDKIDKTDPYWNYKKVTDKPFEHLVINGGNVSNIVFEQSPNAYVKVMKEWRGSSDGSVKSDVRNDTLYLDFDNHFVDIYEKYWLQNVVPVRISSSALLSVNGNATKLIIDKFNHPALCIDLRGDSKIQVNCFTTHFNEIVVNQKDSSLVTFTVSKELFVADSIKVAKVNATGSGTSLLNLRTATIDSLTLHLTDDASIALNGATLKKWGKLE
jgi:hypothetical protein